MTYHYALTQDTKWQKTILWQDPDTPFMSFAYWQALTDSGAIGKESGWTPLYIIIYEDNAENNGENNALNTNMSAPKRTSNAADNHPPVAVLPLFIKGHHQGEYVFDYAWAEAYARYGVDYYPRLVTSVPYTPVVGQRFWLAKDRELNSTMWQTALAAIDEVAKQTQASSWHGLFIDPEQVVIAKSVLSSTSEYPLLERQGCQFLWHNANRLNLNDAQSPLPFDDFEGFLATLTAKKRKNIRAERKKIAKQGLSCRILTGLDISEHDWEIFYQCYATTYVIRGRHPYLTPKFFTQLAESMPEHLMLAQGIDEDGDIIASSLFFYDNPDQPNATLYGRYWGALDEYDSLHFELCYYQGIEFAIKHGLQYFDPGTQGEHKLIRGFVPTKTYSLHCIFDKRFTPAIAQFCEQDRAYMQRYRQQAHEALPFNIDNMPRFTG